MLPPLRVALRLPAVRMALALVVLGPLFVRWGGQDQEQAVRLRVVGMLLAAAAAMLWDDRCAVLTAATPVGLPAVRHGRAVVMGALLLVAGASSSLAAVRQGVPWQPLLIQTGVMALVMVALVGWLARDREGEQLLALPVPVLLVTLALMSRLPERFSLLAHQPGDRGWPDERLRWLAVLVLAVLAAVHLDRDPAARHRYATWKGQKP